MFKRDYLMRQFDMLALVIVRAIGLLQEKKPDAALQAIDEELQRLTGFDSHTLSHLTDHELVTGQMVGETATDTRARRIVLATLLATAGEIHDLLGREDDHYRCTLGALDLLLSLPVTEDPLDLPAATPTVDRLVDALAEYGLPPDTHLRLFRYYEESGRYADAEDMLFEIIDAEPDSPEVRALGIAFFHRLLEQTDEALEAGNLPRAEVEAGLAEIEDDGMMG
jgi:tetratricopeptide (TPR) repeat protein